ncbi:major facilitator superfamily domain-containing protein [Epithele typhae]|uniref:major facilitator superfamily domain-containing protein n=1 Tax=Epithele typhae TaxID=378194 RepID=UPI0020072246|nr:major facilitator superfamily domain-containing protein [Epithele typhae]KAH9929021.1 major facilitator superfamily domain-containing protein [Epithele typhae]
MSGNSSLSHQALGSELKEATASSEAHAAVPSLEDVPDGGWRAWLVVLGSSLSLFASAGLVNAYGTFQAYYETDLLPSSSPSTISFIGSIQIFLLYFLGTFAGRAFDAYGTKARNQLYQVFLSHGVLFGIGISLLFSPALAVIGHWFRRRRALAIGLTTGGSATGGVVVPILMERLIPTLGFPWAVRVVAFLLLGLLAISCVTIKTRLPLSGRMSFRTAIDLGGFRDPRYALANIAAFLLFYAFFVPYFYIQIYADFREVAPHIAHYLLAVMNAMNIVSRILPGLIADRLGTLPVFVPAATICSVLTLGLWLPSRSAGSVIAFAALYGLFSGAFVSLLPTYIAAISPREKFGARLGATYIGVAIASLAGTPTAGALLTTTDQSHFNNLIVFTGVLLVAGTVVMAGAGLVGSPRVQLLGRKREDAGVEE